MWGRAQVASLSVCLFVQLFVVSCSHLSLWTHLTVFFHRAFFVPPFVRGCSVSPFLTPSFLVSCPFHSLLSFCLLPYLYWFYWFLERGRPWGSNEWKYTGREGLIKPRENVDVVQNNSFLHPSGAQINIWQTIPLSSPKTTFSIVLFCLTPM